MSFAGKKALRRESIREGLEHMRAELGYDKALPLEKLLIDNIVLCWAQYSGVVIRYENVMDKGVSITQARYWEQKLSAAHTRYLRSMNTLANVRKLAQRTPLQINVAEKQVKLIRSEG